MFKKLQELLEAGKIEADVAEALDAEISTVLKEKNDEAAKWRVKYNNLNESYEEVLSSKGELESQIQGIDEKIAKAKEEGKSELVKELEAERGQKEELAKKLGELEATTKNLKIENELAKALNGFEYEPVDAEIVSEYLKRGDGKRRGYLQAQSRPLPKRVRRTFTHIPRKRGSRTG